MEIELLRGQLESLLSELAQENYLAGAGLKDSYSADGIYRRHSGLFSPFVLPSIRDALAFSTGEERRRLDALYNSMLILTVRDRIKRVHQEVINHELTSRIRMQGKNHSWRQKEALLANCPHRESRLAVEKQITARARKLNSSHHQVWSITYDLVREMGFVNYREFSEHVLNIDLDLFVQELDNLLLATNEQYYWNFNWFLSNETGIPRDQATRGDLFYLFRGHCFDRWFRADKLMEILHCTLNDLGLSLSQPNITMDVESRPNKAYNAYSMAISIPRKVCLVINPFGGHEDYDNILHECGHTFHYAHTDPGQPFEYKRLGDPSVSEAYAFLFQYLASHARWLTRHVDMEDQTDYLRFSWLKKLFLIRRQAARVIFESWLHAGNYPEEEARKVYSLLMKRATGVHYSPELYLMDLSQRFYSIHYIRGWIFEAQMRQYLQCLYGPDWLFKPDTGDFLKNLFALGGKFSAQELARQLDYIRLDSKVLISDIFNTLASS